jgi:imidazoleglycerol-phosphate dehydratase
VVSNAGINAHLTVTGENDHHKIEALFKAFAVALKRAVRISGIGVPSTKGVL